MLTYTSHNPEIRKIISIINTGKFYSITYIKIDGSLRRMTAHKKIYQKKDNTTVMPPLAVIPSSKGKIYRNNLLFVWDNNAYDNKTNTYGAYRTAKLNNILFVKCGDDNVIDLIKENQIHERFPHINIENEKKRLKIDTNPSDDINDNSHNTSFPF